MADDWDTWLNDLGIFGGGKDASPWSVNQNASLLDGTNLLEGNNMFSDGSYIPGLTEYASNNPGAFSPEAYIDTYGSSGDTGAFLNNTGLGQFLSGNTSDISSIFSKLLSGGSSGQGFIENLKNLISGAGSLAGGIKQNYASKPVVMNTNVDQNTLAAGSGLLNLISGVPDTGAQYDASMGTSEGQIRKAAGDTKSNVDSGMATAIQQILEAFRNAKGEVAGTYNKAQTDLDSFSKGLQDTAIRSGSKALDMSQVAGGTPMSGAANETMASTMADKFALPAYTAKAGLNQAGAGAQASLSGTEAGTLSTLEAQYPGLLNSIFGNQQSQIASLWNNYASNKANASMLPTASKTAIYGAVPKVEGKIGYESELKTDPYSVAGTAASFLPSLLKSMAG